MKKAWNLISWTLVAAVAILAFLLAGVRVIGFTPYTVLSGSMEPTFHVGSLIYVKSVDPADIEEGDPITFHLTGGKTVATHRVIEVDRENKCFRTQGDANDTPDATLVAYSELIGKAVFTIPGLGFFSEWISNPPGTYAAIAVGAMLVLVVVVPDLIMGDKKTNGNTK